MLIREARLSDLEAFTDIYNWAVINTTATFDLIPQTIEARREWYDKHGGAYPLLAAEVDGRVAGYSSLSKFREKEAYASTVELSVYVHPDFQGNGTGTELAKKIIDMGWEIGYHTIVSGITAGNEVSIKMHEKLGFQCCGTFREVGRKFNKWQDVVFYQLTSGR